MPWRRVVAPVALLAVLLLALAFRWDTEAASKIVDGTVIKYERDRFTGYLRKRVYVVSAEGRFSERVVAEGYGFWKILLPYPRSGRTEDLQRSAVVVANVTWFSFTAAGAVWLIVAARKPGGGPPA